MANRQTASALVFGDLVSATGSTQLYPLGAKRDEEGKVYRYVKRNDATVAPIAGNLAYHVDGAWAVCMDVSDVDRNLVAGVFLSVIADGEYGWIQTGGLYSTVKTNGDDDIALGDAVIASAAGDGTADSTDQDTAPICKVVGFAVAADVDADDTVAVFLELD